MKIFRYSHAAAAIAILAALGALGGLGWLVYSMYADRQALSTLDFEYQEAQQKHTYASSVRALLRDIEDDRRALAAITAAIDPVEAIRVIEGAAKATKTTLTVNTLNPDDAAKDDPSIASYTVSFDAGGTFAQLHQFITTLETLPMPTEIEQIRMDKREKLWHMSAIMRIYADEVNR